MRSTESTEWNQLERSSLAENVRRSIYRYHGATCRDSGRFVSTASEAERFWSKVDVGLRDDCCWEWTAATNQSGYPVFRTAERTVLAHRWAYEWLVGPIAEGLTLDHLCETPACVRPDHLEPVTNAENLRRRHARRRARLEAAA